MQKSIAIGQLERLVEKFVKGNGNTIEEGLETYLAQKCLS